MLDVRFKKDSFDVWLRLLFRVLCLRCLIFVRGWMGVVARLRKQTILAVSEEERCHLLGGLYGYGLGEILFLFLMLAPPLQRSLSLHLQRRLAFDNGHLAVLMLPPPKNTDQSPP